MFILFWHFTGWRGNIKETIAKGWWTLNTERTDQNATVEANSGENSSDELDDKVKRTIVKFSLTISKIKAV